MSLMTNAMKSRVADLKVVALIVTITAALAGGAWSVVSAFSAKMDRTEAETSHTILHKRITAVDDKASENTRGLEHTQQTIGRDVRTIKCILTAPKRGRKNCGLE